VIDTSVVVAGLRSRHGASSAVLDAASDLRLKMVATPAIFLEYEQVLRRPEQKLAHGLDDAAIEAFLAAIARTVEPVKIYFQWKPQLSDSNDEIFSEAAISGSAKALITHNVRDFSSLVKDFGIEILTPKEILRRIEK
jgi:putative PIN family toxin of toxin-antitoxin system